MKHTEIFTGRVGVIKDLIELQDNNCLLNFSVAETPRVKNKQTNQWEDGVTIWTNVTVFGEEARNFQKSVKKGTFVTVVGTRTARKYTPKDSNQEVVVQSVVAEQLAVSVTRFNYIEGVGNVGKAGSGSSGTPAQTSSQPNTRVDEDPFATSSGDDNPFGNDDNPFA